MYLLLWYLLSLSHHRVAWSISSASIIARLELAAENIIACIDSFASLPSFATTYTGCPAVSAVFGYRLSNAAAVTINPFLWGVYLSLQAVQQDLPPDPVGETKHKCEVDELPAH